MSESVVGQRIPRTDAAAKVTGAAVYTSDLSVAGMAHAALIRSTVPHGRLRSIDVSAAESYPGVVTTLRGAEIAYLDPYFGESVLDQPPLAIDTVRFVGEPLVGIVAETERAAAEAAELVDVEIDPLPTLGTIDEALADNDTIIHPERVSADDTLPNVCHRATFEYGDVDAAMESAEYIHRATYRFPSVSHYAMEPHACIASWGPEGLEVWSGTQQPFKVRADLARIFKLPLSSVRVRVPYVGGGYGGKGQSKYEPLTAALARKAGRPVRLVASIAGSFQTVRRHAAVIESATALDGDGNIVARDTKVLFDTGAYADKGPRVATKGAYRATGPYRVPNARSVGLAVYTNTIPAGAFRGFSTPQVVWASESAIDEVAAHLGEDPVSFRAARLSHRGEPFFANDSPLDADLADGLSRTARAVQWSHEDAPARGRGVAVGVKDGGGGTGSSRATVRINPDGSIEILVGTSEMGQGARTVFAQLAADELRTSVSGITVRFADTDLVPFDRGTNASRSTVAVGSAVVDAARQAHKEITTAAEQVWGSCGTPELADETVLAGARRATLRSLLAQVRAVPEGEVAAVVCEGSHDIVASDSPLGSSSLFYEVGHGGAEVTVDEDTGEVHLLRYVSLADVGFALNPTCAEGQDEGAVMMGVGHTLFEELEFTDGEPTNTNLFGYRLPRAADVPAKFHTLFLESHDGPGPHGAKGVGEGGVIPVAPAVANAVYQATGVRIRELPMTPERVWRALRDAGVAPGPTEENDEPRVQ
jgi:CO/xanthine dehydrogenase Mo-binding subunit